jgi:mannose-6-phosphate isomerase-like protein (cupin superfamily)
MRPKQKPADARVSAPRIVRQSDAFVLIEEGEFVRVYHDESRLQFSTAELLPGTRGPLDPGHPDTDEVAYVIFGQITMRFPDHDLVVEASAGDAIIIPPGVAHEPVNAGVEPAMLSWSLAPNRSPVT